MAGIDATAYIYKDAVPVELGKVCSGGTAYPIAKNDSYLYTASNHWGCKYIVAEKGIQIAETAGVEYDPSGNATYFYMSEDGGEYSEFEQNEAEEKLEHLFEEMATAEVISFDTMQK